MNSLKKQKKLYLHRLLYLLSAAFTLLVFSACTHAPVKEFNTYKETFNQARDAARTVIVDHSVVESKISGQAAALTDNEKDAVPLRDQPFDVDKILADSNPVDHIAVRLQAWDVVARYNDVLTALVEGKGAEQVTAATESLVTTMGKFPASVFKDAAASIIPALNVLTTALTEIQKEYDRKKALKAMIEVFPQIRKGLIEGMLADAANYFEMRRGGRDKPINRAATQISKGKKAFTRLAYSGPKTGTVDKMVEAINKELDDPSIKAAKVTLLKLDDQKFKRGGNKGPLTESQLKDIQSDISAAVATIKMVDDAVADYRELMSHYIVLLQKVDRALEQLVQAAGKGQSVSPDIRDLLYATVRVQRAYMAYRQNNE